MEKIILFLISIFLSINMGSSGFAVSFTPSYGSRLITKNKAVLAFTIFLLIGAIFLGPKVSKTIGEKIIDRNFITPKVALVIIISAGISLFIANLFKIPQSTSLITLSSITGVGIFLKSLNLTFILKVLIIWILTSIIIYLIVFLIFKRIYPPHNGNFNIYERLHKNKKIFTWFVLLTNFYSAFSVGTNNVANVVGPISTANIISTKYGLILFSFGFGLGASLLGKKVLNTISNEIIPIGLVSATILSLIISTVIVIFSIIGLPAPYVQFSSIAILAIYSIKEGFGYTHFLKNKIFRRLIYIWFITPFISILISFVIMNFI